MKIVLITLCHCREIRNERSVLGDMKTSKRIDCCCKYSTVPNTSVVMQSQRRTNMWWEIVLFCRSSFQQKLNKITKHGSRTVISRTKGAGAWAPFSGLVLPHSFLHVNRLIISTSRRFLIVWLSLPIVPNIFAQSPPFSFSLFDMLTHQR